MIPLNPRATDERTIAERRWRGESPKWAAPKLAAKPLRAPPAQQPCDHGMFGDEHLQMDLVEMFQDPAED